MAACCTTRVPRARRLLITELVFIVATAVLQGAAFLLLVPLLQALLRGDTDAAWSWLTVMAAVGTDTWSPRGSPARSG